MIYIRGNPADYDEWRDLGWGWDDLLPYFLRAEDNVRGASEHHGVGGPLRVSETLARTGLSQAFLDACAARGLPASDDFNAGAQDGFGWYQLWMRDGGGPLSSNGVECGGFLRTRDDLAAPDVQFHFVSAMFEQEGLVPAP